MSATLDPFRPSEAELAAAQARLEKIPYMKCVVLGLVTGLVTLLANLALGVTVLTSILPFLLIAVPGTLYMGSEKLKEKRIYAKVKEERFKQIPLHERAERASYIAGKLEKLPLDKRLEFKPLWDNVLELVAVLNEGKDTSARDKLKHRLTLVENYMEKHRELEEELARAARRDSARAKQAVQRASVKPAMERSALQAIEQATAALDAGIASARRG